MTREAAAGSIAAYLERRAALEGEIVRLREAVEHARAAAGAATSEERRAYGRRLNDENDDLRRENAALRESLQKARVKRKRANPYDPSPYLFAAIEQIVRMIRR